jgi:hypothetical protein
MKHFIFILLLFSGFLAQAQSGIIQGKVTKVIGNEPIEFATIVVVGQSIGINTDAEGNYEIKGLEPGLYNVEARFSGFQTSTSYEIQVTNSKPAVVDFALEEASYNLDEVVINPSAFKKTAVSPVSLRTIGVAEIQRNPGANRDISRVVQSLPGVTSTASFRNDLIIRGGAPNENRFYLDDVEVPNINHFATQGASGGPVGLINVNFIREVDFYSGAFPANRGNSLSSVFNFRQRNGRTDRLGATFMLGASDAGLTFEGPIGEKASFLFSARRSYLGFLFSLLELPFLPTYNDFQAKVKYTLNEKNELYFIGLGAVDQFDLNLDANETENQQFLLDNLPETPQWNYTNGLVYKHYGDKSNWTVVLSRNMLDNKSIKYFNNDKSDPDNLILDYESQEIENKLRIENDAQFNGFKLNLGVGAEYAKYNNRTFSRIFTPIGPQTINFQSDFDLVKYYTFGQISRNFQQDRLSLSLGFRMDGNSYSDDMNNPLEQFSPRFSLAYSITNRLSFNFNTGIYYQLPPYTVLGYQEDGALVNRQNDIRFIRADHLVAGLEYNTSTDTKISVEGYYKRYHDYPFLIRDSLTLANLGGDFGVIGNEPTISRSAGRTYGLEVLVQQRLYKGFYGILAYTLSWSEFEDKNGKFVPSSWDSRHIVNLTMGKKFNRGWLKDVEIGVNWRLQTGLPFTPFAENSSLVQSWDVNGRGLPDYSRLNTQRTNAANGIDFRIDKKWFFEKWSLNVYFDIENLTGNAVGIPALILDKNSEGERVILNPTAPIADQRYRLKTIDNAVGTVIPSLGLMIEL